MRVIYSVSNLFCEPYNFWKQQDCRKRQKVGRNQSPHCSTIFPLRRCDAGCDLLLLGQHLSSLVQVILHCTHSLHIKQKPLRSSSASCGRMGYREKPVGLGCSEARGAAASFTQQREWKSTAQQHPQLCSLVFASYVYFSSAFFPCTKCGCCGSVGCTNFLQIRGNENLNKANEAY